jgi:hypothetical protein
MSAHFGAAGGPNRTASVRAPRDPIWTQFSGGKGPVTTQESPTQTRGWARGWELRAAGESSGEADYEQNPDHPEKQQRPIAAAHSDAEQCDQHDQRHRRQRRGQQ